MAPDGSDADKLRGLPCFYVFSAGNRVFSELTWFGPVFVLFLCKMGLSTARIRIVLSLVPL